MNGYQLAHLNRFIDDHQRLLASQHCEIPCAGMNLQAVKTKLNELNAQILLHRALAFPEAPAEIEDDDDLNRRFHTPMTKEQELHYRLSENLEMQIPQLKKLLAVYETLVARLN